MSNEDKLELFADILEPASEILGDNQVRNAFDGKNIARAARVAIKNHKEEVIEILARLDGKTPENYAFNPFKVLKKLLDLLNSPEVTELFTSQETKAAETSSGFATGNTGGGEN